MSSNFMSKVSALFGGGGGLRVSKLDDNFSVCGQPSLEDLEQIKQMGFNAIICNRPDNEAPGQVSFYELSGAAEKLGIASAYVPVSHGEDPAEATQKMAEALQKLPGPILAYCRSGARSSTIWQAAK
ncbi:TIGR01244 family sulfur transferase [Polycladidibacter stylochi]|uniref:TIGR01244 family sulfur transferase n=1 Tax=Polycladidibacter stylochi TaxID=1807766 RepID=UPI00082E60EF|nr:TIGR01244 family sulfur transferase [Pseudovibrio stylochi]